MKTFPKPRDGIIHSYMTPGQRDRVRYRRGVIDKRDFIKKFRAAWVRNRQKEGLVVAMGFLLLGLSVRKVRPEDLLGKGFVHFKNYKKGTGRIVAVPPVLYKLLDLYFERYYKRDRPFPLDVCPWGKQPHQLTAMEIL